MADDDVQLPDLEVISLYSLAVRAATAPRDEVIAALEADLAWLRETKSPPRKRAGARRAPRKTAG
jgi:hypothetical protein